MKNLIWIPPSDHAACWKSGAPDVLVCALQPRLIDEWRRKNRWADHIDMIIFTDDEPPETVRSQYFCRAFADQTGHAPHMVVNAPPEAFAGLDIVRSTSYAFGAGAKTPGGMLEAQEAAMRYRDAVAAVGKAIPSHLRCAWIQPESDHAIGACALTQAMNRMVLGYSSKAMIDSIGVQAATLMHVNVRTLGQIRQEGGML